MPLDGLMNPAQGSTFIADLGYCSAEKPKVHREVAAFPLIISVPLPFHLASRARGAV